MLVCGAYLTQNMFHYAAFVTKTYCTLSTKLWATGGIKSMIINLRSNLKGVQKWVGNAEVSKSVVNFVILSSDCQ